MDDKKLEALIYSTPITWLSFALLIKHHNPFNRPLKPKRDDKPIVVIKRKFYHPDRNEFQACYELLSGFDVLSEFAKNHRKQIMVRVIDEVKLLKVK